MKKAICILELIIVMFTLINAPLLYNLTTVKVIGRYSNQFYFDNGKEIYVVELQPRIIMKEVLKWLNMKITEWNY